MSNEADYVELGLACADVCTALGRGMNGKKLDDLSQSVCDAIAQLAAWVDPVTRNLDSDSSLTISLIIAELWGRSKGRSSDGVGGMRSLAFSMQRTTRKRLPLGSWTSIGSFTSSMYVRLVPSHCHLPPSFRPSYRLTPMRWFWISTAT